MVVLFHGDVRLDRARPHRPPSRASCSAACAAGRRPARRSTTAHGARHADLQRGPGAQLRIAARDGDDLARSRPGRQGSRCSCCPTRRTPTIYVQETAAFQALREALGERMRVWYRRRTENVSRKAGNLHDFVTRWGGRYDFMIVLDADSILAAGDARDAGARDGRRSASSALLADRAAALRAATRCSRGSSSSRAPSTARRRARRRSVAGRRRQLLGAQRDHPRARVRRGGGLARSAGAQAVRRADPVARLRRSRADSPRGLGRADAADAGGSWEESPPSLLDVAARDRRWAQGNLQHLAVVGSAASRGRTACTCGSA